MGIQDHLTCLLRNLYADQEATFRTGHETTDWFQIGKGVRQGCILSPCLFNLYAEYIMRNSGLEEAQAGIKIAGRNINNLRYAGDTTLMAESILMDCLNVRFIHRAFLFIYFYFTILYWFCHTATCIRHGCTCVPHPESSSHLPPHTIPLGHPSAPAPSFLHPDSNMDWRFVSYMILYMF